MTFSFSSSFTFFVTGKLSTLGNEDGDDDDVKYQDSGGWGKDEHSGGSA